jgi:TonB family protein
MHGARKAFETAINLRPDFAAAHGALAEHLYTTFHRMPEAWGAAGRAVARAVLGADGKVRDVEFLEATVGGVEDAVLKAVRGIRFVPALKDGRLASIRVTFQYNLGLE